MRVSVPVCNKTSSSIPKATENQPGVANPIVFSTMASPINATEVIATEIFKAFSQGQYGLGTAVSSVMFVVLLVAGYFVIRLLERSTAQE